jgi:hypothetical protein
MRGVRAISAALIIILFVPHLHAQDLHSESYKDGQRDRILWELWFSSLKGKSLAGAKYWANHRSIPKTPSCADADIDGSYAWQGGCNEARRRLAASDQRRKLDPEYRQGGDAPEPSDAPEPPNAPEPPPNNAAIVSSPANAAAPSPQTTEVDQTLDSFQDVLANAPEPPPKAVTTYNTGIANEFFYKTMVILAVLGFLLYRGYRWYYRAKIYKLVVANIKKETSNYAKVLAIKRRDTLSPDESGTLRPHEWEEEKILFTRARILPILQIEHLAKFYDKLSLEIDEIIERAAGEADSEREFTIQHHARELFKNYAKKFTIKKRL